jgi:hypothetical protein
MNIGIKNLTMPTRTSGMPVCPACGGLECLCRPRFFAGQLLTEEDLNRLDYYIVAKQKLHNRYLHGWGVVCGLDVVCDGCDSGSVMVRPGYALSPCGEDVIICGDTRVPICNLISDCRDASRPDCRAPTTDIGCNEPIQQWVLAICYAEIPSRGVVPLRSSCGSGCGCGASGGCGCGCGAGSDSSGYAKNSGVGKSTKLGRCDCNGGSSSPGTVATTSASRGASLMQCENTVVCESYGFRVYKAPRTTDRKQSAGAMADAFQACVKEFTDAMPSFDLPTTGNQAVHDWCCALHDAFADWFLSHPPYGCDLVRRIAAIACPNPNDQNFDAAIAQARSQFLLGALEILLSCFCSALMPPCPAPPGDDCVPLAVVTVSTVHGCQVQNICNWTTQRKYVTTFPSLQYWLSILPFGRLLREAIEGLCCKTFLRRMTDMASNSTDANQPIESASASTTSNGTSANDISPSTYFRGSAQTMARSRAFMQLAVQSLVSRETSANAEQLVLGMVGDKDAEGNPVLTELERENLLQFLVLDQMAKPTIRNVLGDQFGGGVITRTLDAFFTTAASTPADAVVAEQIDELRATVERQQRQLDELLRHSPPRGNNV